MSPEDSNQEPKSGRWKSWQLVIFVVVMAAANVWMIQKTFSSPASELPKLKINVFSASSFVIKNARPADDGAAFNGTKNILVLGRSGPGYIAPNLTDSIFIVHLAGPSKKVKIISLPRDLAISVPGTKAVAKINSLYQTGLEKSETQGLNLIRTKVEEITGLKIDSFVLFDLATVEKIIDDIGGLNVYVKENINDNRFPAKKGGYETFRLSAGNRFLNGENAMRFIRTRNSGRGDFDRIERQQTVVKALKGKLVSLNPVWDFSKIWSIFKTVQSNVRTDLGLSDLKNAWGLFKKIDLEKIETFSLNSETGLIAEKKMNLGAVPAYVLVAKPQAFEYDNIKSEVDRFLEN